MRDVPQSIIAAWRSGDFTGDNRPMARVTVQRPTFRTRGVNNNVYMHFFNPDNRPKEIPNILSVSWNVDVDSDTGTCTIEALNTKSLPLGERPPGQDFDYPGYYTPQHGTSAASGQWNHEPNEWLGMLLPDNLIRTFEGYGWTPDTCPSLDPKLVQTGVWRIDDVDLRHDGGMTITCRDVGSILHDQILYPPIVPFEAGPVSADAPDGKYAYPVQFVAQNPAPTVSNVPLDPQEVPLSFDDSSNTPYVSSKDAEVYDHRPSEAFDGSNISFWWSVGNARPDQGYSYEWIQGKCPKTTVSSIRFWSWGTKYTVFASVYADGEWKGGNVIPYDPNHPASAPNGSNIPYVATGYVPDDSNDQEHEIVFDEPVENVTKVRLTFTNLWYSATGPYKYRADCRELRAFGGQLTETITTRYDLKNYNDYTDIVKLLLAWGGFWWPSGAYQLACDGTQIPHPYTKEDPAITIAGGRVWGDFKLSGTYGPAPLDVDVWDKKPIMDGIRYVAEILGYLSYVDETGGFVFRPPNVYRQGNIFRSLSRQSGQYTTNMVRIDERHTLRSLSSKLSSRNVRERVFVANLDGGHGHMSAGWNPNPTGLRRVGGWCVDEETEILTELGWKRWNEVKAGDKTLSLDDDGNAYWQEISKVAIFDAEPRTMVKFEANNFDAMTTPDHRWLVETLRTQTGDRIRQYRTTDTLSRMDRSARAARGAAAKEKVFSDSMVELVAWTYTEGSVETVRGYDRRITIYQSPTVNPDHCESIRLALKEEFGDEFSERYRKGCIEFTVGSDNARSIWKLLGPDKEPLEAFLGSLTQDQLELFIDVSVKGDGHERYTDPGSKTKSRFFYQNVGPRLDSFLMACALAGIATSCHYREGEGNWHGKQKLASVTLLSSPYVNIGQISKREVEYDGRIWCPAMPEHHNWLARRNGAVYFTGNTDENFSSAHEARMMAEMITLRQLFTYRTDSLQIPANPQIQIDDQVRIYERVTSEGYIHYVKGISSNNDMVNGEWTYDLTTHWLGERPFERWLFDERKLSRETRQYLKYLYNSGEEQI